MPRRLLRFLPDRTFAWIELTAEGRPGPVRPGLPPATDAAELWLAVPAEDVLLLTAARPPGSLRQVAQALPYAIEDRLAAAVESQHVAWSNSDDPKTLNVAVLDRDRMRYWLDMLAAAGLEAAALVPEPLLLPWSPERPSRLVEGGRALLRYGAMQAFCGRAEEIATLGLAAAGQIEEIAPERVLARMAEALRGPPMLNVLQGEFEPVRRRSEAARPWRWSAGLAAAMLMLMLLFAVTEQGMLAAKVDAQYQEMASLYRQAVPGATVVADAEHQLRTALGGRAGDGDLALRLLSVAAPVLAAAPGMQLDAIDYRGGQLELVVLAPDVASLDALRGQLQGAGLRVELTAATPGSRGVEGRLMLRAVGA